MLLASTSVLAQQTTRVSVSTSGAQGSGLSPVISAEGRYVAFESVSPNFVPNDTNGSADIFVRDRQLGVTECVSVSSAGAVGNGDSSDPAISSDGRYVVFASTATNLDPADTNIFQDIYVRDRALGTTQLVSVSSTGVLANDHCDHPAISADGRYVVFVTDANTLTPEGTLGMHLNVYLRDLVAGTTELVSHRPSGGQGNGNSDDPSISADGRFIAFDSLATNLVVDDQNGSTDIFVLDRQTGVSVLASVSSLGAQASGNSLAPSLSADGRIVAFTSHAPDLVPGDTNTFSDIFVRDLLAGTTQRVSVDSSGAQANSVSDRAAVSGDGRFVGFHSYATNLVAGDTNGHDDVFLHDLSNGVTEVASVNSAGVQSNTNSLDASLSYDARYVAFGSLGSNLAPGDTNNIVDAFVHDRGPSVLSYCFGDASQAACPCGNTGAAGHGCENSASTGGAVLTVSGTQSLGADSVVFTSSNELPSALSIVLQGTVTTSAASFGDGLRCVAGSLKRLYVKSAAAGVASAPSGTDLSVSARSQAAGDPIPAGASRFYQVYYRDPNPAFCPAPSGNTWNISSGIALVWDY